MMSEYTKELIKKLYSGFAVAIGLLFINQYNYIWFIFPDDCFGVISQDDFSN